jgi:hypothetical protein
MPVGIRGWVAGSLAAIALAVLIFWAVPPRRAPETRPVPIAIEGGPELPSAEISGLAWRGDELVLLPQYPARFGPDGGALFVADRGALEDAVDHRSHRPVRVREVPLIARGLESALPDFDGYEAIAFAGDDVYLSVENRDHGDHVAAYLVRGHAEGTPLQRIVVDIAKRAPLRAQADLPNTGYEALVVVGPRVLALYEANGDVNPSPRVLAFDRELTPLPDLPLTHVEYRITDATASDAHGRFWVTNYHWPSAPWPAGVCQLTERYGQGETHARCRTVERLVELQATATGVNTTDRAPILLSLVDDEHARNWEGAVRLPGRGFLIMTDEHPASILAFVPAR